MKFAVGDFVSYKEHKRHGDLVGEYVDRWGYGPFEIIRVDFDVAEDYKPKYVLATHQGQIVEQSPGGRAWMHSEENLQLEVFLTAARKAIATEAIAHETR